MRIARKWLGIGPVKSHDATDVESLSIIPVGGDRRTFGFSLKLRDGKTKTIANYIGERQHAEFALGKMLSDLGRSEP
jgi:hypothetical protein